MRFVILLLLAVAFIIVTTTKLKLHPFLALLLAAMLYGITCGTMALKEVVDSINSGFGGTIGYIGIVIVAGSVIGTFLEKSGGALKLDRHVPGKIRRGLETGRCHPRYRRPQKRVTGNGCSRLHCKHFRIL